MDSEQSIAGKNTYRTLGNKKGNFTEIPTTNNYDGRPPELLKPQRKQTLLRLAHTEPKKNKQTNKQKIEINMIEAE
jgi:hypothetical protein